MQMFEGLCAFMISNCRHLLQNYILMPPRTYDGLTYVRHPRTSKELYSRICNNLVQHVPISEVLLCKSRFILYYGRDPNG
jgi:hypothetical protein